jgi:hypothetical protein
MFALKKRMHQHLFERQPVVVVNNQDPLDQVLQLRTDLLIPRKTVLTNLHLLQRLFHRLPLKGTTPILQTVKDNPHRPHVRSQRIPKPTHRLRSNVVRSTARFPFQLSLMRKLTGKPKVPQFERILRINIEIAQFETEWDDRYSRCSMPLEWM